MKEKLDTLTFIMAVEDGSMTKEYFEENVQEFVDSNIWRSLQGSWQRTVLEWARQGYCTIKK